MTQRSARTNIRRAKKPSPEQADNANTTRLPIDYAKLYSLIGGLIESLASAPKLLEQSGLNELQRRIALLQAQTAESQQAGRLTEPIEKVCQFAQANLNKRLSMADLEAQSGLSARTLQYHFKRCFGCSPMRWMLLQRLQACHQRFLQPQEADTITSVAIHFGFSNLGNFARLYQQHLGELPSQTLLRARN